MTSGAGSSIETMTNMNILINNIIVSQLFYMTRKAVAKRIWISWLKELMALKGFCKVLEIDTEAQRPRREKSNRQARTHKETREKAVIELEIVAGPYVS